MRGVSPRYERVIDPAVLAVLRRMFRRMNRAMVLLWRLGLGRLAGVWPRGFGRLMVIEHVGRRSGRRYRTPLNYSIADGDVYCIAAFGEGADWYRNIDAERRIQVWLPDGRWEATVVEPPRGDQQLTRIRDVLVDSGFAAPLFGLHPRRMTDEDIASTTAEYRLVRIHLERRSQSTAGPRPGDLAWPAACAVVGAALCRELVRRRAPSRR